jgi:hypothetical protein
MGKKLMYVSILLLVLGPALAASATPGPIGWWKFDDGSGAKAVDSVGGLDGVLLPADTGPTWVAGKMGGAIQLDGTDDYVELPIGNMVSALSDMTVTSWVNWGGTGMWARVFDFGTNTSIYMFMCPYANTNQLRFAIRTAAVGEQVVSSSAGLLPTGWHHVGVNINATTKTITLFQDGAQVGTGATTLLPKDMGVTTQNWLGKSQWPDPLFKGSLDDFRIYDRALTADEVANAMVGELGYGLATTPSPANKATDVWRDEPQLTWKAGPEAKTHDVYFGTDLAAVTDATSANPMGVLVSTGQAGTSYKPGRLALGTTYYWRIDEVGSAPDYVHYKGNTWSFTVEPVVYNLTKANITATASSASPNMGPEKTIDGSGINADGQASILETDMWLSAAGGAQPTWIMYAFDKVYALSEMLVWNSNQALEAIIGYGAKGVTVEFGVDPNALTTLGDFTFNQAPGDATYKANTTVDFGGKLVKYVKLTINSNWGGLFQQYGLSEVRFTRFPYMASYPNPASGTTGLDPKLVTLTWRPGRLAAKHEVYLGTDQKAVEAGTALAGTVTSATFLKALELNRTYYWKITEVNQAEDPSAWPGEVWNFKTLPYYTLYTFGDRALKFGVANARAMNAAVTDWTLGGATTLVITFTGAPSNAAGQMYIQFAHSQNRFYVNMPKLQKAIQQQWNLPLADLKSTGLDLKNVPGFTIGVLSEGSGTVTLNNILLYRDAPPVPVPTDPGTKGLSALYKMEGDMKDGSGNGLDGATFGAAAFVNSMPGLGKALDLNGTDAYATMAIGDLMSTLTDSTFAVWLNWTNTSMWARAFDIGTGTNNYLFVCGRASNNQLRVAIRTPTIGEQIADAGVQLPTGWHHVAATFDAPTMTLSIWLDGTVAGKTTTVLLPKDMGVTTQNYIGKSQWPDPLFMGQVDDFRIYNRVLTVGEMHYLAGDR